MTPNTQTDSQTTSKNINPTSVRALHPHTFPPWKAPTQKARHEAPKPPQSPSRGPREALRKAPQKCKEPHRGPGENEPPTPLWGVLGYWGYDVRASFGPFSLCGGLFLSLRVWLVSLWLPGASPLRSFGHACVQAWPFFFGAGWRRSGGLGARERLGRAAFCPLSY